MVASRNRRPGYSRRARMTVFVSYVVLVASMIVAVLLVALSVFDPSTFSAVRLAAAEVTTPVASGTAAVVRGAAAIPQSVSDHFGVMSRNAALRQQIEDAKALTQRARALSLENRRLKALLALRERTAEPIIAARLVSSTASSTRRFAVINAGFRQGVKSGQPVRGPAGLIGRIVEAGPDTARVLLLSDPESIVPVRRTRDGLAAIATGRGDGLLEIRAVMLSGATFQPGDLFMTSGVGGIYPPNIPVAQVIDAGREQVRARSFEHPDTLDYALVSHAFLPEAAQPAEAPR